MNVLAVLAHPRRDSFTGAVLDRFVAGLEAAGHSAEIADLHTEGFDPRFTPGDYAQFSHEAMPDDVLAEQARVERNEGIALVFPFFWWGFPAMLKGWVERVWCEGWAYHWTLERPYGLLNDRSLVVLGTCGSSERNFSKWGYDEAIRVEMDIGTFGYVGIQDVTRHMFYEVDTNAEARLRYLDTAFEAGRDFGTKKAAG
jgi:NAD(P)H dehydrogenase (quinone)